MLVRGLRYFAFFFGAVCVAIALGHILIGPRIIPGGVPVNATMDSEDRFYATLFLGYGAAMIWSARDLAARRGGFLALIGVFFLGGVARLVSFAQVGPPHPLFIFLAGLELVLPPVLWLWLNAAHPQEAA
ncbi:MAG: DUF4345 domain-containing protein [Pseudomonadota bacterium]